MSKPLAPPSFREHLFANLVARDRTTTWALAAIAAGADAAPFGAETPDDQEVVRKAIAWALSAVTADNEEHSLAGCALVASMTTMTMFALLREGKPITSDPVIVLFTEKFGEEAFAALKAACKTRKSFWHSCQKRALALAPKK